MSDPRRAYLQYVTEVLGADRVLRPKEHSLPETELESRAITRTGHWPPPGEVDLLVIHRGPASYFGGETLDLWEKMKAAMKLPKLRWLEVETSHADMEGVLLDLLNNYPAQISLLLSETPKRSTDLRVIGSAKVLESFSPAVLLHSPDLKKPAWEDLKLVMRSLGKN